MSQFTAGPWRYEQATTTIRSVPGNHWIATMDSFDRAVDSAANARLIAASPSLYAAAKRLLDPVPGETLDEVMTALREAVEQAEGTVTP